MTILNGNDAPVSRPLTPGIYAPIPTFFLADSEDLDIPTLQKHVVRMATAGIGILLCGSMGEANHLSIEERVEVIQASRAALDAAGFVNVPIIAGSGVGSTKETIRITLASAKAGADYAIVIPSGYYAGALASDRKALKTFFKDVSEASPIPIMIYNYPGAAGGIDMDSDLIEEMAKDLPNLCGVKLTCGNVGKLTRICSVVSTPSFAETHPRKNKDAPFLVLGGFIDFLLPSLYANGHGAITGLANAYPYTLHALWQASLSTLPSNTASTSSTDRLQQAQHLQGIVAHADRTIALTGIPGTKWLLQRRFGYGGLCRKPLAPFEEVDGEKLWAHQHVVDIENVEKELEKASSSTASNGVKKPLPLPRPSQSPVANGVPVSNGSSSPSSHQSSPSSLSAVTSNSESLSAIKGHSRSGSLTNGVRSLIGSLRKKKTVS